MKTHLAWPLALIALFLAANLRAYKSRMSVLLVTNEHRGVIYQIFKTVRQFGYPAAGETAVIPGYAYKNDPEQYRDYEIKLTTEPEVRLMSPEFYYTPAILDKVEIYRLREHFRKAEETRSALRLREMREIKGVKKVFTPDDLSKSLEEAFHYSLSGDVIIEEFKQGEELSVDVYVEGTTAKLLSITASKKIQENKDSFTIIQSYYPAPTDYKEERVLEICQKIADAWHLHDTPLLVQMIQKGDSYNVLEFSARMGGGSKYRLIQVLSGVDIMKVYVEMVMGETPHVEPQKQYNNAIMSYIYCYPGVYKSVEGLDELKTDGVILDWFIYRGPESIIEKSNTSSDRAAGFLVVGDSEAEVKEKLATANARLKVLNDKGEDFMRHDLL